MEIEIKHSFKITPEQLALEFWNMSMDDQADFFNELAKLDKKYTNSFYVHIAALKLSKKLTPEGIKILNLFRVKE